MSSPEEIWVGRLGSFVLVAPRLPEEAAFPSLVERIVEKLRDDSRVVDVEAPTIESDWCFPDQIYPSPADPVGIVSGSDVLGRLRFSAPIAFRVEVPAKNQPLMAEGDDVPTRYEVLWNGVSALVTWRAPADKRLPLSGGHVVSDILRAALEKVDLELYVQACSPACTHEFAHSDIRFIEGEPHQEKPEYEDGRWYAVVDARYPPDAPDFRRRVFADLTVTAEEFANLKSLGRRILEIEDDCRSALAQLMAIDLRRAELALEPWRRRIAALWTLRGWRRQSRRLIARVWAALGNIERLRREWDQSRFSFEEDAAERGRKRLFVLDYADEVDGVRSFDPDLMRTAVQEAGARLDNRALLLVTGLGAVAGAIAGGIVGGIAGNGL